MSYDPNCILTDALFKHDPGFDADAWLRARKSARVRDIPELGTWINEAGRKHDISGRVLVVMAQKEQSAITRGPLDLNKSADARAYHWLMGVGCFEDGTDAQQYKGPRNQVFGAAATLRSRANGTGVGQGNPWIVVPGKRFSHPINGYLATPANWATAALYTYNPSKSGNENFWRIWRDWFGDPTGGDIVSKGRFSVHPDTWPRLQQIGVSSAQITQGVGYVSASAGTHSEVGKRLGRPFGHCIDISASFAPTRSHFDLLVEQGFIPFFRDWAGNRHWHCIDAMQLCDDAGNIPVRVALVISQINEWFVGEDGLIGDGKLPSWRTPTADQKTHIRRYLRRPTADGAPRDRPGRSADPLRSTAGVREPGLSSGPRD